ncbi:MAG TPA: adenosine kinase [Bacteroidales bacterium]|nr:adenosine kinase [Bacteroidales bacterium]
MKKILGIGNALVDVMTQINDDSILERFEFPKGSMQLVDEAKSGMVKLVTQKSKRTLASGGSAANTLHGLSMIGAPAGFIGSIGEDELGDFFENDMKKAGVSTMLLRRDTVTGTAVALISPDSERTFATHLGAAVELDDKDLRPEYFRGYNVLYMEGYLIINRPMVEKACMLAKENRMKVAIDLASYNVVEEQLNDFREIIDKYVDIVFANEDEARAFTGLGPEEALKKISESCEIAVVKVGSEGSWIKRGDEIVKVGTEKVDVKDTTGAGDLYASGFLYGYARDLDLEKCGLIGSLLAGKVIENIGARMSEAQFAVLKESVKTIINYS